MDTTTLPTLWMITISRLVTCEFGGGDFLEATVTSGMSDEERAVSLYLRNFHPRCLVSTSQSKIHLCMMIQSTTIS